jgi:hypothetical protein
MRLLICSLLICFSLNATGQTRIYKIVDAQGNVTFTDKPPSPNNRDASTVKLNEINISAPTSERDRAEQTSTQDDNQTKTKYTVSISSPPDSTTIPMGPGNFSITANVSPALGDGAQLQLSMNGTLYGEPQTSSIWLLNNVLRGAHDFSVSVVAEDGAQLAKSSPVRIYVLRPSKLYRN